MPSTLLTGGAVSTAALRTTAEGRCDSLPTTRHFLDGNDADEAGARADGARFLNNRSDCANVLSHHDSGT